MFGDLMPRRRKGKDRQKKQPETARPAVRPNVPYWEDPVYRFVSGMHRKAQTVGNQADVARMAELMQRLVNKSLPDDTYLKLDAERRAYQQKEKQERKKMQKGKVERQVTELRPSVNVAELKRRIFNPQTAPQNMIKALEALPADERKKTVQSLTPFLRSKIAKYLQSRGY